MRCARLRPHGPSPACWRCRYSPTSGFGNVDGLPPGRLEDPTERVLSALSEIAASGDRVAVITHGDIVYLIRDMLGVPGCWESGSDVPNGLVLELRPDALLGRQ